MPLQATSGAASYDAFGGGVPVEPNYIESVFSTFLYTGNGSTQTINNGIDLAGKGGLVWTKTRNAAVGHGLIDTVRGGTKLLQSNTTAAEDTFSGYITAFGSTGYTLGASGVLNDTYNMASWTFREQPKFFDVVTYTGTGSPQNIAHNLGSVPGCIIVKRTDANADWAVYHRSLTDASYYLRLNLTSAEASNTNLWNSTAPTSTVFTVGSDNRTNASGSTYVAYLFAHNAGGFGLSGTDNVISCGSFTTDGSGRATVNLGYEPQWVLIKQTDGVDSWYLNDNMRGMAVSGNQPNLSPNSSAAESAGGYNTYPNATGFTASVGIASKNYIYIAIRRGPMRTPTTGTSVFKPLGNAPASTDSGVGFPADMSLAKAFAASQDWLISPRLTSAVLYTNSTAAEGGIFGTAGPQPFDTQDGFKRTTIGTSSYAFWAFKRAPGFFDVVCYTGTGSTQNVAHNLGVVPELLIIKRRNGTGGWESAVPSTTAGRFLVGPSTGPISLNTINNNAGESSYAWASNTGTATYFNPEGIFWNGNVSGATYVAYLFASCPGVSRVGTYTGNGSSQTINCGFTSGARFVMIKSVLSAGNWIVADSARGIVANNDPALYLNSTAAEITGFDWIDADSTGFVVNETATIAANSNGNQYIFLAIA